MSATEIASRTGRPRPSIQTKLTDLEDRGLVENLGAGTYAVTERGLIFGQTLIREEGLGSVVSRSDSGGDPDNPES
jgi:DNA-binding IclR family transcriptional regulator